MRCRTGSRRPWGAGLPMERFSATAANSPRSIGLRAPLPLFRAPFEKANLSAEVTPVRARQFAYFSWATCAQRRGSNIFSMLLAESRFRSPGNYILLDQAIFPSIAANLTPSSPLAVFETECSGLATHPMASLYLTTCARLISSCCRVFPKVRPTSWSKRGPTACRVYRLTLGESLARLQMDLTP